MEAQVMEISTVISTTANFMKFAGEIIAGLKRQEFARIDAELLNLKKTLLTERFEEFKSELETAVKHEQARAEQDLISRGLSNSTLRSSILRGIEQDASNEVAKGSREFNRTMEEIALLERKLNEQAHTSWKRVLRFFGVGRA
jgi:hypothetical protein